MQKGEITERMATLNLEFEELFDIVEAVSQVYPMIVLANLTQNKYLMLKNERFLYNDVVNSGNYEDLIDDNMDNIHPNYQRLFNDCFSREHLIRSFNNGKTEVYAELYQKDTMGKYQWVSVHVIKLKDKNGDIRHVCLNRVLDGVVENHGNRR